MVPAAREERGVAASEEEERGAVHPQRRSGVAGLAGRREEPRA